MMRLALPKGRNLGPVVTALQAAGLPLSLDMAERALRFELAEANLGDLGIEVLLLKDWDLPLYVEEGVADFGFVGSDVIGEVDGDLLVPLELVEGRCRLSLIGKPTASPGPGTQVRLATKYPKLAERWVAAQSWSAEIVTLSGSVELAPLLELAEVAVDVVQTGRTLAANGLVELERVLEVAPTLVVNRASYPRHRARLNELFSRLEAAGVAR
jgi:ATP phosphoribosyltransferase